jgi:hypothetical protein
MLDSRYAVAYLNEALRYKTEGRGFDGIIGIFHLHNPSVRTMALGGRSLGSETLRTLRASASLYRDCFTLYC